MVDAERREVVEHVLLFAQAEVLGGNAVHLGEDTLPARLVGGGGALQRRGVEPLAEVDPRRAARQRIEAPVGLAGQDVDARNVEVLVVGHRRARAQQLRSERLLHHQVSAEEQPVGVAPVAHLHEVGVLEKFPHDAPVVVAYRRAVGHVAEERLGFRLEVVAPLAPEGPGERAAPGKPPGAVGGLVDPDRDAGLAELVRELAPHLAVGTLEVEGHRLAVEHVKEGSGVDRGIGVAAGGGEDAAAPLAHGVLRLIPRERHQVGERELGRQAEDGLGHVARLQEDPDADLAGGLHDDPHLVLEIRAGVVRLEPDVGARDDACDALPAHRVQLAAQLVVVELVVEHPEVGAAVVVGRIAEGIE